jgi:hypothetical protein
VAFQLREVKDLAEELGSLAEARAKLKLRGIEIWDGYYNHGAYLAVDSEPDTTNIRKSIKKYWTLAPTDGVGAIKHLIDAIGLDITLHQWHQTNWVMVRNERGQRQQVKVYSTQRYTNRHGRANFGVSGFLTPQAPAYYMFVCYEGPRAWVVPRKQLIGLHKQCFNRRGKDLRHHITKPTKDDPEGIKTSIWIPKHRRENPQARTDDAIKGHLLITFDPDDDFRLMKAGQLGL